MSTYYSDGSERHSYPKGVERIFKNGNSITRLPNGITITEGPQGIPRTTTYPTGIVITEDLGGKSTKFPDGDLIITFRNGTTIVVQ